MSEAAIREDTVLDALRAVMDPDLNRDIVSLNFIRNLKIEGTTVSFDVNLTTPACPVKDRLREQSKQAVLTKVPGVKDVLVNMTSEVRRAPAPDTSVLHNVRNIIAVGAGRGASGNRRWPRTSPSPSRRAARASGSSTPTSTAPASQS